MAHATFASIRQGSYKTGAEADAATETILNNMIEKQLNLRKPTTTPAAQAETSTKHQLLEALRDPEVIATLVSLLKAALIEDLGEKYDGLEARVAIMEAKLNAQEVKLNSQEAELRNQPGPALPPPTPRFSDKSNNLVLTGVAETQNEIPADLVSALATSTSTKLGNFVAKRIGKVVANKTRAILVTCESHWDKRKLFAARTQLKECGYENTYLNEDLTPRQGEIFFHARNAKKQSLIKSSWTDNGTVWVKPLVGDQPFQVSSLEHLKTLLPNYTVPAPRQA